MDLWVVQELWNILDNPTLYLQQPELITHPPPISDVAAKQRFLKSLIELMQQNPIPLNAPRFTREMLHERR